MSGSGAELNAPFGHSVRPSGCYVHLLANFCSSLRFSPNVTMPLTLSDSLRLYLTDSLFLERKQVRTQERNHTHMTYTLVII